MLSVNMSDIAHTDITNTVIDIAITAKNVDYLCIVQNISISEIISLLEDFVLEDCGYIQKNIVSISILLKTVFLFFVLLYTNVKIRSKVKMLKFTLKQKKCVTMQLKNCLL